MKIAETCVKYPIFTVMLITFLVTLGVFSYRGLAVDLFPKADPATVNVEVRLPGATPEEVVTGVVLPLEDAISSVSGIDEISVWSFEGYAEITCTFVLERDIEGAAQDIREKVAGAIDRLPRDTLPPIITKQDPQSDPIMTLLVSGPMSRRELTCLSAISVSSRRLMGPLTRRVMMGSDCGSCLVMMGGRVSRGKRSMAPATFSRMSWAAPSMSRSRTNVQVISAKPSNDQTLISSMPLTEEMASSSGNTTPVTTSSGVAPGRRTSTFTVAGSALGKRSTARPR